MIFNIEAGL